MHSHACANQMLPVGVRVAGLAVMDGPPTTQRRVIDFRLGRSNLEISARESCCGCAKVSLKFRDELRLHHE